MKEGNDFVIDNNYSLIAKKTRGLPDSPVKLKHIVDSLRDFQDVRMQRNQLALAVEGKGLRNQNIVVTIHLHNKGIPVSVINGSKAVLHCFSIPTFSLRSNCPISS